MRKEENVELSRVGKDCPAGYASNAGTMIVNRVELDGVRGPPPG